MVRFVISYEPLIAKRALSQVEVEGSRGDTTLTSGTKRYNGQRQTRSLKRLFSVAARRLFDLMRHCHVHFGGRFSG